MAEKQTVQTVQTKELLKVLEKANVGIAQKELLEQSASFVFTKNKIITFNDEIFCAVNTDLKINAAIEAQPLLSVLKKIKDDEIEIWTEDNELRIKGKKIQTGIKLETQINLPIDDIKFPEKYTKLSEDFCIACNLACLTASKSLSDPLLMGVHINKERIESCDNDRVTICTLDKSTKIDALIPAQNLLKILRSTRDDAIVGIAKDDTGVHFKTKNDVMLACRLIDEKFLDVSKFIPKEEGKLIHLPEQINEILDRADVFSKDNVSLEKLIHISLKEGKLVISSQNDSGWIRERAKTKYKGPDISFSINSDFMKDILKLSNQISIVDDVLLFKDEKSVHMIKLETE